MLEVKGQTIYLITGTSGVGKDTIAAELLDKFPSLERTVSVTTRWPARQSELYGETYTFTDQTRFDWLLKTNQLIESSKEYGNNYGLTKFELDRIIRNGKLPLQLVDFNGLDQLIQAGLKTRTVFLDFPNTTVQHQRILHRQPEISQIELDDRLSLTASDRAEASRRAATGQLSIIINDHIAACVSDVAKAFQLTHSPA